MADVWTSRITYAGPYRLDVTAKSGTGLGALVAPSWMILRPILERRKRGDHAGVEAAWPGYVELYRHQLRRSYRAHRAAWAELLAQPRVLVRGARLRAPCRLMRNDVASNGHRRYR